MKTSRVLISGGRVVDPTQRLDAELDVLLENGRVAQLAAAGKLRTNASETVNARGLIVAPGFVDIHVHLREPGQAHKETIASGTRAAAAGGFTSVCCMPNTAPVNDSPEITRWMQHADRGAVVNVFPIAAATVGSAGERLTDFAALRKAGAVAFTDDGKPVLGDSVMRDALRQAAKLGVPVIQHAEDTRLTAGASMNAGAKAFRLGLRGWPAEAEWKLVERDIALAAETRAHMHVAHLSTAQALEAVRRARRKRVRVTCEVTPHHFALADADMLPYDSLYKMNPPLRSPEDRDALLRGLISGAVDAIATDHAPHAEHEKQQEFERAPFGITGLETALGLTLKLLYAERGVPLMRVVELLSSNPARIVGLSGRGTLAPGAHADVVLFDPKKKWVFERAAALSKSVNTPFDGWKMQGRVVATIVGGRVVYSI